MKYYIGADIGTTSTKVVLFDEFLNVLDTVTKGYRTYQDQEYFSEQDPEEVFESFVHAVSVLMEQHQEKADKIEYIAFSSAMHSLILMDEGNQPMTRSILWSDSRAEDLAKEFKKREDADEFYEKTGTPLHPMSPFFKLLWFKENTDLLENTYKAIGIKEYVMMKLTGEYVVDYSVASATGLFHLGHLRYDEKILKELSMETHQFSRPVEVEEIFSVLSSDFRERTGVSMKTKLIIGGSDGCLSNLGGFVTKPYEAALSLGTSGAVRITTDRIRLHPDGKTFCYYLRPGQYVIGGAVNNGGNVFSYLSSLFYEEPQHFYDELPLCLKETEPGAEGVTFVPYLHGERAPHYDGHLFAGFTGISPRANKRHFIRAAAEGILYNLKEVLLELEGLHGEVRILKVSGGVFESNEMAQLLAEITGLEVQRESASTSAALGAVLLGLHRGDFIGQNPPKEVFIPGFYSQIYGEKFLRYLKASEMLVKMKDTLQEN